MTDRRNRINVTEIFCQKHPDRNWVQSTQIILIIYTGYLNHKGTGIVSWKEYHGLSV